MRSTWRKINLKTISDEQLNAVYKSLYSYNTDINAWNRVAVEKHPRQGLKAYWVIDGCGCCSSMDGPDQDNIWYLRFKERQKRKK